MRRLLSLLSFVILLPGLAAASAAAATPTCFGLAATIEGTKGPDQLIGTPRADVIVGLGGSDFIDGRGGNDRICGGDAPDSLLGGTDSDRLDGGDGEDGLRGESGADVLLGRSGDDRLYGGWGPDRQFGGAGRDTFKGDRGKDHIDGGPAHDTLDFFPPTSADWADIGGQGIRADLAAGELFTIDGEEILRNVESADGTPYADVLKGTVGRNVLRAAVGADTVVGRGGNDYIESRVALGGAGDDVLQTVSRGKAVGHSGDDVFRLFANDPGALLAGYGGPGNDHIRVLDPCNGGPQGCGDYDIRLAGGDGRDRVEVVEYSDYARDPEPHRFDLPAGRITNLVTDFLVRISSFEQVVGTPSKDLIIGTDAAELLMGTGGNDTIQAGGGDDVLAGGTRSFDNGPDSLDGGNGNDTCFTSGPPGTGPADSIEDCETHQQVPVAPHQR